MVERIGGAGHIIKIGGESTNAMDTADYSIARHIQSNGRPSHHLQNYLQNNLQNQETTFMISTLGLLTINSQKAVGLDLGTVDVRLQPPLYKRVKSLRLVSYRCL